MSDPARSPAAASNTTHEAFASAVRSGSRPFDASSLPTPGWAEAGAIRYPTDPNEADKLADELARLSTEFNCKVPGKRVDGRFVPEPLKVNENPRPGQPRLDPRHLPSPNRSPAALAQMEAWKEQGRMRCQEPGCYHPVTPKRLERVAHEPILFHSTDGGQVIAGECAWEPRHAGGLQFIPVPKEKK